MQQPIGKWNFIFRETRSRIILTVILFLALLMILLRLGTEWWSTFEPIITFLTLGVAILVLYQQMSEEWERAYLPKRFTGRFYYKGQEVMRFENAWLTSEGDARQLAQQIGSQMVDVKLLKFVAPEVEIVGPKINQKEHFVHYTITFNLTEIPKDGNDNELLNTAKVRVWKPPFINSVGSSTYEDYDRGE
ncbi:MAG: hypothetical protein OEV28_09350 [Nitrospirota bacterium]|nr:hypothetical protein [Nitrospirota bacterium]